MDFLTRFIEELQALEEGVKHKVLIVGTVLAMAVIMYLWAGYFGSLITAIPQQQPAVAQQTGQGGNQSAIVAAQGTAAASTSTPTAATSPQNSPSFWDNMKSGMANIYNTMRGPQQYDIKPSK